MEQVGEQVERQVVGQVVEQAGPEPSGTAAVRAAPATTETSHHGYCVDREVSFFISGLPTGSDLQERARSDSGGPTPGHTSGATPSPPLQTTSGATPNAPKEPGQACESTARPPLPAMEPSSVKGLPSCPSQACPAWSVSCGPPSGRRPAAAEAADAETDGRSSSWAARSGGPPGSYRRLLVGDGGARSVPEWAARGTHRPPERRARIHPRGPSSLASASNAACSSARSRALSRTASFGPGRTGLAGPG